MGSTHGMQPRPLTNIDYSRFVGIPDGEGTVNGTGTSHGSCSVATNSSHIRTVTDGTYVLYHHDGASMYTFTKDSINDMLEILLDNPAATTLPCPWRIRHTEDIGRIVVHLYNDEKNFKIRFNNRDKFMAFVYELRHKGKYFPDDGVKFHYG